MQDNLNDQVSGLRNRATSDLIEIGWCKALGLISISVSKTILIRLFYFSFLPLLNATQEATPNEKCVWYTFE